MFGLTIEKLFLVALLAAVIIGPRRLPDQARRLGSLIRRLTVLAGDAARRAEQEAGVASIRQDWTALDPRQYDPRRIIREAWAAGGVAAVAESAGEEGGGAVPAAGTADAEMPGSAVSDPDAAELTTHEPAGTWVVGGSSGHPRRVWVPAES